MLKEIKDFDAIDICDYKFCSNDFECVYGYYLDNQLIGVIDYSVIYDRIELNYIFVMEMYRKNGIASIMMEHICNMNLPISLEVCENNFGAIELYKKYGFKSVARRKNYYGEFDGILMVR